MSDNKADLFDPVVEMLTSQHLEEAYRVALTTLCGRRYWIPISNIVLDMMLVEG